MGDQNEDVNCMLLLDDPVRDFPTANPKLTNCKLSKLWATHARFASPENTNTLVI